MDGTGRTPRCVAPHPEAELIVRAEELRSALQRLVDAAEAALSTAPDMPLYEETMDEFEMARDEARQLLKEEWPA